MYLNISGIKNNLSPLGGLKQMNGLNVPSPSTFGAQKYQISGLNGQLASGLGVLQH